jgi:hypothetical protein
MSVSSVVFAAALRYHNWLQELRTYKDFVDTRSKRKNLSYD